MASTPRRTLRVPDTANAGIRRRAVPGPGQPLPHAGLRQFRRTGAHEAPGKTGPSQGPGSPLQAEFDRQGPGARHRMQGLRGQGRHPLERRHRGGDRAHRRLCPASGAAGSPARRKAAPTSSLSIGGHRHLYVEARLLQDAGEPLLPVQGLPAPRARLTQGASGSRPKNQSPRRGRVLAHRQQVADAPHGGRGRAQQLPGLLHESSTSSTGAAER